MSKSKSKKGDSSALKLLVVVAVGGLIVGALVLAGGRSQGTKPAASTSADAAVAPLVSASASGSASMASTDASATDGSAADATPTATAADLTMLREAAAAGNLAKVQELHAKGAPLTNVLGFAATSGDVPLLTWLVDHGVDPHEGEAETTSPLLAADGHEGAVAFLLARGVKDTTVIDAARVGAANSVVRLLAKNKADAKAKTLEGEPALLVAIRSNAGAKRQTIVNALLAAGADASASYERTTALGAAVTSATSKTEGAMELVKLLLDKGAVLDTETVLAGLGDKAQTTALQEVFLAPTHKIAPEAAYLMIMNERDPKMIARIGAKGVGWTTDHPMIPPTPPLVAAARELDVERVRALLAAGAPVDRAGEGDETALYSAIDTAPADSADAAAIVAALLAKGANPNKRTAGGRRPLHAASEKGEEAIVKSLLAKGAHVDDEVGGVTALEAAEANGHAEIAKLLVAKGAKKKKKKAAD